MSLKVCINAACLRSKNPKDKAYAIQEIINSLKRTGGNVHRSAPELGVCRRHLDRLIYRYGLRSTLEEIRKQWARDNYDRIVNGQDWLIRTKEALSK